METDRIVFIVSRTLMQPDPDAPPISLAGALWLIVVLLVVVDVLLMALAS